MPNNQDLFDQINDVVLDLQEAQRETYERPLKTLARLLHHEDLEPTNRKLTEGVDLEAFLAENASSRGSMVGSNRLKWPNDHEQVLAITLLLVDRFATEPEEMMRFGYRYFRTGYKVNGHIRAMISQMIIPFVREYRMYVFNNASAQTKLIPPGSSRVFVAHGHDEGARESVARLLERLGLEAVILHEQANRGRTVIEKVEANSDVGFAVVLLTPDDEGSAKGGASGPRVRQNVLLELGYFIGKLGRERVCAIMKGEVDVPSDFAGVVWEKMETSGGWKQALGRELQAAGYSIDWNKVMR